jgi:hypothetical protein
MFKGNHTQKFTKIGFCLGLAIATTFTTPVAADAQPATSSAILNAEHPSFSILTSAQQKKKIHHRAYVNVDFARFQDRDPFFPGRSNPFYSFIGYEYFPTPEVTYGVLAIYDMDTETYNKVPVKNQIRIGGLFPYINYFANRSWLLTVQAGAYYERDKITSTGPSGDFLGRVPNERNLRIIRPEVGGYATWIGPDQMFTATVRGGYYYSGQRTRAATDRTGAFLARRNFDTTALTLSTRLKYFPEGANWNAFLQIQGDFRVTASGRRFVFHPDNRVQNGFFQIGPAVHYEFNDTWELRAMYLYSKGYGYNNENRIGLRLRAAF